MESTLNELRWKKFRLGSDGYVCLVDAMGTDMSVVQAARISYGNDRKDCDQCDGTGTIDYGDHENPSTSCPACEGKGEIPMRRMSEGDRGLIRYLMLHRHTTPFEMVELKFLVRCPMDLWRQWIRHRTANVNEYSTRYAPAIDSAAITQPNDWRTQSGANKQGSDGKVNEWPNNWMSGEDIQLLREGDNPIDGMQAVTPGEYLTAREMEHLEQSRKLYAERLQFGVAREQARKDLPLSTYTEAYWKIDLHNLFHFLGLRMDSHAQQEIRDFATAIGEQIIAPLYPVCWQAFLDYRMNAAYLSAMDIAVIERINTAYHDSAEDNCLKFSEHSEDLWIILDRHFPGRDRNKELTREQKQCVDKLRRLGLIL